MKILLAGPRGFCAGVVRAVDIVEIALQRFDPPIYVRKEIVHNKAVVDDFRSRGVVFIDELKDAPAESVVVFSAHGVSPDVRDQARKRLLHVIDATCPLVTKVHLEVHRFVKEGYSILLIGHRKHDEVAGTMGEAPGKIHLVEKPSDLQNIILPDPTRVMILTQTTLSLDETRELVEDIRKKFPDAKTPPKEDICYATQNRQDAVKELVKRNVDALLVVGSKNSSNSQRLVEVAQLNGCTSYLIDNASEIKPEWLNGISSVGVTAGASAPEHLVQGVLDLLQQKYNGEIVEATLRDESVHFALPKELT